MKTMLFPYKPDSRSARLLARALGLLRRRRETPFNGQILNWGSSNPPPARSTINQMAFMASNKLETFRALYDFGVPHVPYTTQKEYAQWQWLDYGERVFARTVLNGHSGNGIVNIKGKDGELPAAPLYTLYIQKASEWRVHVVARGLHEAFFIQQKKKRAGQVPDDPYIRSWWNGWVFCSKDINPPDGLTDLAVRAINALYLDFGAVDIIVGKDGRQHVLEVNTAPGLAPSTLEFYATNLRKVI